MVVRVWDRVVRVCHWSFAALVAAALATGLLCARPWFNLHVLAGYGVGAVLAVRLIWGVFGSRYGRFRALWHPPAVTIGYVRELFAGRHPFYLGHNPAGSLMVLALLSLAAILVGSGLAALGGVFKQGPLAAFPSFALGDAAATVHRALAYALLPLIALHLFGVAVSSRFDGQNLARAMITGRKRLPDGLEAPATGASRPLLAAILAASLAGAVGLGSVWAARLPVPGVRELAPNPVYSAECGGCHWAYHPSLLPAASWSRMVDGLADHFGEDASIAPDRAEAIRQWLIGNAAETWDTLPANRLRHIDPAQPLRVTATPFWRSRHAAIPDIVFAGVKGGRGNCTACHRDTGNGRFSYRLVHIPREPTR